jgi:hypothetical protein
MSDYPKDNYWVALARCGNFSEKDKTIFRIFPVLYEKNSSMDAMPAFILGKNLEDARIKAHRFIDKMFDMYRGVDYTNANKPSANQSEVIKPPAPIMDSLSIEASPVTPKIETTQNSSLLDLKDLLC